MEINQRCSLARRRQVICASRAKLQLCPRTTGFGSKRRLRNAPLSSTVPETVSLQRPFKECRVARPGRRIVVGREHADAPHAPTLLRARRERPHSSSAAEQRYELAASHSITSSARASNVGGTVRPSVFLLAPSWRAKRL